MSHIAKLVSGLFLFPLVVILFSGEVAAQVRAVGHDTLMATTFADVEIQDTIYIYHGPAANGWPLEMTAECRSSQPSNFLWRRFDDQEMTYSVEVHSEENVSISTISTNISGGYSVQVTNAEHAIDTTYFLWLFSDDLKADLYYRPNCDELKINGISGGTPFEYFDRHTLPVGRLRLANGLRCNWRREWLMEGSDDTWIPDTAEVSYLPPTAPLFSDQPKEHQAYRFIVDIRDSLGHTAGDTMVYQAVSVLASFRASIDGDVVQDSTVEGQSELKVQFKNESRNADTYRWTLYHRAEDLAMLEDSVMRSFTNLEPLDSITYTNSGYYTVKLKAWGRTFLVNGVENTCSDSIVRKNYIHVFTSAIGELPNAFTPNNDGLNDLFKFKEITESSAKASESFTSRSIKRMEVHVYSRSGDKVYEYVGDDDDWEGWDGTRRGRGNVVQPGVYYWVVKAEGWDGEQHVKNGYVHVFR